MATLTVRELIKNLLDYDLDKPVQIRVRQYNKRFPVAYVKPEAHSRTLMPDTAVVCENGVDVSIDIMLPYNSEKYMMVQERKIN